MIEEGQAEIIGNWFANQILSHDDELENEIKLSEDGIVKCSGIIQFRRIADKKFQIKCKFKIPRESIQAEDVFDMQLSLFGKD